MVGDGFKKNRFIGDNRLADFPNVDGVVALTQKTGCGMTQDEPLTVLRRTLRGYARHANFSAVVVLGLGCEDNQIDGTKKERKLSRRPREEENQWNRGPPQTSGARAASIPQALAHRNKAKSAPEARSDPT